MVWALRHLRRPTQPVRDETIRSFYGRWIAACAVGELVGIGTATGTALVANSWIGEPGSTLARMAMLATFAAVGIIEGGALAFLQWRVLRMRLPRLLAGEWVAPTVAIAVAGWVVGMTPSLFLVDPAAPSSSTAFEEPALVLVLLLAGLAGAGAGACFGAAQWFVLRRHAERAHQWIWIHVPAWALAMAAIFLGATVPSAEWTMWAIGVSGVGGGVLGGLLLGVVTGLVARRLTPWVDEHGWSLRGKVCAVTGANSGIGYEVAKGLTRLGASVLLLCRRPSEGDHVRQMLLTDRPGADITVVPCDMSDFTSIRQAADRILADRPRLDILVHNAGATFPHRTVTADGVEATLAVDVVGPYLLTSLLKHRLEASRGRVIVLTGIYHRKGHLELHDLSFASRPYVWLAANNQAQRGRFLFIAELARRVPRLSTAAVHPGAVLSGAQAKLPWPLRTLVHTVARPAFVRAEVGAIPVLRLAAHPNVSEWSGRFFNGCHLEPDVPEPGIAEAFWQTCEHLTGAHWQTAPGETPTQMPVSA